MTEDALAKIKHLVDEFTSGNLSGMGFFLSFVSMRLIAEDIKTVVDHYKLSEQDARILTNTLLDPPEPNETLKIAQQAYSRIMQHTDQVGPFKLPHNVCNRCGQPDCICASPDMYEKSVKQSYSIYPQHEDNCDVSYPNEIQVGGKGCTCSSSWRHYCASR